VISERLVISARFCGPPNSGNGGYVCGCLASHMEGPVAVRLKAPPPKEADLQIEGSAEAGLRLSQEAQVIAQARRADVELTAPRAPSLADAEKASESYVGFTRHPFPSCFVCGPRRPEGDGLRIFPRMGGARGMRYGQKQAGLRFCPFRRARQACWVNCARGLNHRLACEQSCIVVGWKVRVEGRKRIAGSALFSNAGTLIAIARATWIEVSASAFGGR
jgi:hypothetical protein